MKDWALQIAEDLDSTQEFIKIVRQAPLGVTFGTVWKNFDLGFLTLGFRRQSCVHGHVPVPHEVADRGHGENHNKHPENLFSKDHGPPRVTYNVVKFMVKVKLMEKSVKSHAGKV